MLYQISYQEVSVFVEFNFFYRVVCPFHASNRQYKIFILSSKGKMSNCTTCFHALPAYLSDEIERVQRRALSIISPELSYHDSLDRHGLASLYDRRMKLCTDLFLSVSNPSHKLYNLLPDRLFSAYNTRHRRVFNMPRFRTDRFKFSFIPVMCACANLDF